MQEFQFVSYEENSKIPQKTLEIINNSSANFSKKIKELGYGDWMKQEVKGICHLIKEWNLENLKLGKLICYLGKADDPLIIKEISEIKFPHLKYLDIFGNKIESCEKLSRINMP